MQPGARAPHAHLHSMPVRHAQQPHASTMPGTHAPHAATAARWRGGAPREPLQAVRKRATRLGQVGGAPPSAKPLCALALLPPDVPGAPAAPRWRSSAAHQLPCRQRVREGAP